jgi:hypothetical protein
MALVEQLAFSLRETGRGVHALLWDDMGDLVRTLLVTHAVLGDIPIEPLLVSGETKRLEEFRDLIAARLADQILHERIEARADDPDSPPHPLWILFLQQAASEQAGPRLNGWRRPLSEPRGTLLVVRNADFRTFQRSAPDLASFIGPRIYDASRLMMVCSKDTLSKLEKALPEPFPSILRQLPGTVPTAKELADWTPLTSSEA